jgi:hypothetical protein
MSKKRTTKDDDPATPHGAQAESEHDVAGDPAGGVRQARPSIMPPDERQLLLPAGIVDVVHLHVSRSAARRWRGGTSGGSRLRRPLSGPSRVIAQVMVWPTSGCFGGDLQGYDAALPGEQDSHMVTALA